MKGSGFRKKIRSPFRCISYNDMDFVRIFGSGCIICGKKARTFFRSSESRAPNDSKPLQAPRKLSERLATVERYRLLRDTEREHGLPAGK